MFQNNKGVPLDSQLLYILRHWDELHERLLKMKKKKDAVTQRLANQQLFNRQKERENKKMKKHIYRLEARNGELERKLKSLTEARQSVPAKKSSLKDIFRRIWE